MLNVLPRDSRGNLDRTIVDFDRFPESSRSSVALDLFDLFAEAAILTAASRDKKIIRGYANYISDAASTPSTPFSVRVFRMVIPASAFLSVYLANGSSTNGRSINTPKSRNVL